MSEGDKTDMSTRIENLPWYTVPGLLVLVPALALLLGRIYRPFYENVIWQYYWGPIKADAFRTPGSRGLCLDDALGPVCAYGPAAFPGYNLVNTLSWAVLLGVCIIGLVQLLQVLRTRMDSTLIIGGTSWVVAGSVFHVLQDTGLFGRPLEYIFITPPIYLLFAVGGIISLLVGVWLERIEVERGREAAFQTLWLSLIAVVLLYTLAWLFAWNQVVAYVSPLQVALIAALTYFVARWRYTRIGRVNAQEAVLLLSVFPLLLSLAYVMLYLREPWSLSGSGIPSAFITAPILAAAVAGLVYVIARARNKKKATLVTAAFMAPINLLLIFGQMVDAFATALGIDLAGYTEKHVLPGFIIEGFQKVAENIGWAFGATYPTFIVFTLLKLGMSILVIWVIDIYSREDVQKYPSLIGIIKFAVIMVGIGPGVRNMVRLSLGV